MTDIVERLRDIESESADAGIREEAADEIERLRTALGEIETWSRAYPLTVFLPPDYKRARELLEAGGMTLDAISADCMRHVVEGVGEIARRALEGTE
jgi:hypothetical protein